MMNEIVPTGSVPRILATATSETALSLLTLFDLIENVPTELVSADSASLMLPLIGIQHLADLGFSHPIQIGHISGSLFQQSYALSTYAV